MIRIATEADVPAILSVYAPYIMDTTITFEYDIPTEAALPGCGYKFGRWLGVIWMEKQLNLVESPSSFPADWKMLCQDAQKICNFLR